MAKRSKKSRQFVKICLLLSAVAFFSAPQRVYAAEETDDPETELVLQEQKAAE